MRLQTTIKALKSCRMPHSHSWGWAAAPWAKHWLPYEVSHTGVRRWMWYKMNSRYSITLSVRSSWDTIAFHYLIPDWLSISCFSWEDFHCKLSTHVILTAHSADVITVELLYTCFQLPNAYLLFSIAETTHNQLSHKNTRSVVKLSTGLCRVEHSVTRGYGMTA